MQNKTTKQPEKTYHCKKFYGKATCPQTPVIASEFKRAWQTCPPVEDPIGNNNSLVFYLEIKN
ncbi:hypothetical protein KKA02_03945 [Patescibacteria group bacterium]|nr:hypothetical protein [Patescibacteria group bacterium]